MKDSIIISQMDCCAGKWRCEVNDWEPSIHDCAGVYIQFVEGCGYHVWDLTPDEAIELGKMLIERAEKSKKLFEAVPKERHGDINLIHEAWYEALEG